MFSESESGTANGDTLTDVIHGLKVHHKHLPNNLLFDVDSLTIEKLNCQTEYYITRSETKIMTEFIDEISAFVNENSMFLEFGCGDTTQTRILLDNLPEIAAYIPADISSERLNSSLEILKQEYPGVEIKPLVANFTEKFDLPPVDNTFEQKIFFLPGSKIGCFTPYEAKSFLKRMAKIIGENGLFLVGVDLKKDKNIIENAYNDHEGLTKSMNLNIINHLNEEFGDVFEVKKFDHIAYYNEQLGRVEMYLKSNTNQTVNLFGNKIRLERDEKILTQYFYKYTLEEFEELVFPYFDVSCVWTDKSKFYSLHLLKVAD